MKLLLDTNVLSEPIQRGPDPLVPAWIAGQPSVAMYMSAISLGEVDHGLARMQAGRRQDDLVIGRNGLIDTFGDRLLPVDADVAAAWGRIRAAVENVGRKMPGRRLGRDSGGARSHGRHPQRP